MKRISGKIIRIVHKLQLKTVHVQRLIFWEEELQPFVTKNLKESQILRFK